MEYCPATYTFLKACLNYVICPVRFVFSTVTPFIHMDIYYGIEYLPH